MRRRTAEEAEVILRAAGAEPREPYPGRLSLPWKAVHLACGKEIEPRLSNYRGDRTICIHCARALAGANRRAGLADNAIAEMRAAGWEPITPYPGTDGRWLSRHEACGIERETTLNNVRRKQFDGSKYGCETCWRQAECHHVWTEQTATEFMAAADLTPLVPWPGGSSQPWRSRHNPCGQEVSPRLGNLAAGQGPCAHCGQQESHAKLRLDDNVARVMMERAGLEPLTPFPGVDHPWPCIHTVCGRETSPTYTNIKRGQGGCTYCGIQSLSEMFRMPEGQARAVMLERGLEPLEPYINSSTPWRCRHTCGKEVSPMLGNVSQGFGICRYCNSSFPYDGPALVYLVADSKALKIGMAKPAGVRIEAHVSRGWRLKWTINVNTGDNAYLLEQSVIRWWRETLNSPPVYTTTDMPQYGGTETVSWDAITPTEVLDHVQALATELGLELAITPAYDIDQRPQRPASNRAAGRTRRPRGTSSDLTLF